MGYDFSAITSLLLAVIPVFLILFFLSAFREMMKSLGTKTEPTMRAKITKRGVLIVFALLSCGFLIIGSLIVKPASAGATATASPSSGSPMLNFPFPITYSGCNASQSYDILLDGSLITTLTSGTDGSLLWTYSFPNAGSHTVTLRMHGTTAIVCTVAVFVVDIIADYFLPFFTILIVLAVLGAVLYEIKIGLRR